MGSSPRFRQLWSLSRQCDDFGVDDSQVRIWQKLVVEVARQRRQEASLVRGNCAVPRVESVL